MKKPILSIVMPVYNEEKVLPSALDEALEAMRNADFFYEILLCNDASTDNSGTILQSYASRHPQIRILTHSKNKGIMGSLETLFESAKGDYIFFNSSDGQFKTADCLTMMKIRHQYDIIVGKREVKLYNWRRHLVSYFFNLIPRLLFRVETHDAGSIKLYSARVLRLPLISQSPFREAERIIRAHRAGMRVGVVSVAHLQRRGGRATGGQIRLLIHSMMDVFRCFKSLAFSPSPKELETHGQISRRKTEV